MGESRTKVADHLERAADLLLTKGLARGSMVDTQGRICAGRALLDSCDKQDRGYLGAGYLGMDRLTVDCPAAAMTFAHWLLNFPLLPTFLARTSPGAIITYINDRTDTDMAEEMRLCAKELRADAPPGV